MTVTRSESGDGELPETTLPKLRLDRSSEIDSTGCTSTLTAALTDVLGTDPLVQEAAGERPFRGRGATAVKSPAFAFGSLQPPASPSRPAVRRGAARGP